MPIPVAAAVGTGAKKLATKVAKRAAMQAAAKRRRKKKGPGGFTKAAVAFVVIVGLFLWMQAQMLTNMFTTVAGAVANSEENTGCTTAPGGAFTTVADGSGNVDTAMRYLLSVGLKPHQAAGLVGNWQVEATPTVDPAARNSLGYTGIAQWDPARRWPQLQAFAAAKGLDPMTLPAQLRFAAWELGFSNEWETGPGYAAVGAELKQSTTADQAAKIIFDRYEIPGDDTLPARQTYARALAEKYKNGAPGGADTSTVQNISNTPGSQPAATGEWRVPTSSKYILNSGYGLRDAPGNGGSTDHQGADMNLTPEGGEILAASSGTVKIAGPYGGLGNAVVITHPGGITTLYGHMRQLDPSMRVGVTVQAGQRLGWEGTTGNSTGVHLHYGVQRNGAFINPVAFMESVGAPLDGQAGSAGTTGVPVSNTTSGECGTSSAISNALGYDGSNRPGAYTQQTLFKGHVNYQQCDPSWGNMQTSQGATLCAVGCGPFAMSNIIQNFGVNVDPSKLTLESSRVGVTTSGGSSITRVAEYFAPKFNLRYEVLPAGDKQAIIDAIQNGAQVMISGIGGSPYLVDTGHIIGLYGYDKATDSFYVSDSGTRANNLRTWPVSEVLRYSDNFGTGRTHQRAVAVYKAGAPA